MKVREYIKVRTSVFIKTQEGKVIQVAILDSFYRARKFWKYHKHEFRWPDGTLPRPYYLHKYSERGFVAWLRGEAA